MARDKIRRVFEHVNEAMQLAQDIVRDVLGGLGFAVDVNRNFSVLEADFLDEFAQIQHRRIKLRSRREFLIVDRQNEC